MRKNFPYRIYIPDILLYLLLICFSVTAFTQRHKTDSQHDNQSNIDSDTNDIKTATESSNTHLGNMFYDGKVLTFFDFDDSAYKHYISDIAIIIFYNFGLYGFTDKEKEDKTYQFLKHFCEGYLEETNLDYEWFDYINDFLKLREIILYVVLHAAGESKTETPFAVRYFKTYRDRIKNDIPFFNYERAIGKT